MRESSNNKAIRVLIVDDHDLVRHGFKSLLGAQSELEVCDTLDSGEACVDWCRDNNGAVDVILMDVNMPGIGGLEATQRISRAWPHIGIIVVTVHDEGPLPKLMLNGGARGYITKGNGVEEMLNAIRDVHNGKHYIAQDIAQQLALATLPGEDNPLDNLSLRETQVLIMIAKGAKNSEISEILHLSPKTISTYRKRLHEKLQVDSDMALLHLAMKYGVLDADINALPKIKKA